MRLPKVVGNYEIQDLLGQGNYGEVRRARHLRTEKCYAVKIVRREFIASRHFGMDIRREMSILMAMDHPNIIKFHDVCVGEEQLFIIMDLAANGDLFSFVDNCGALPEWRARSYFSQLAGAVTYCHSRGVYHRDLKPENILLTDAYRTLEVADFGFAAVIDKQYDVHPLLRTNCGSPHYCAPEVWNGERKGGYDGSKADAFSCGVILYCMLVGAQPFHDSSVDLILAKVNRCEFDVPATVSAAACDLVEGLLRRDPNCRINLTQAMLHPWTSGKALAKPEVLKTLHEAKGGILGSCSGTTQVALKRPLL